MSVIILVEQILKHITRVGSESRKTNENIYVIIIGAVSMLSFRCC